MISFSRLFIIISCLIMIAACGGGETKAPEQGDTKKAGLELKEAPQMVAHLAASQPGQPANSQVSVVLLTQLSETRVSRTLFDYVFKISVKNSGPRLDGVVLRVKAVGAGTIVLDGSSIVGTVASNSTAQPADTISLRHDRLIPFDIGSIVWEATWTIPVNVAGSDLNNNGIRDDVESFLNTKYSDRPLLRVPLLTSAHSYQLAATNQSESGRNTAEKERIAAAVCLSRRSSAEEALDMLSELKSYQIDSRDRALAESAFRDSLAGKTFEIPTDLTSGGCE